MKGAFWRIWRDPRHTIELQRLFWENIWQLNQKKICGLGWSSSRAEYLPEAAAGSAEKQWTVVLAFPAPQPDSCDLGIWQWDYCIFAAKRGRRGRKLIPLYFWLSCLLLRSQVYWIFYSVRGCCNFNGSNGLPCLFILSTGHCDEGQSFGSWGRFGYWRGRLYWPQLRTSEGWVHVFGVGFCWTADCDRSGEWLVFRSILSYRSGWWGRVGPPFLLSLLFYA